MFSYFLYSSVSTLLKVDAKSQQTIKVNASQFFAPLNPTEFKFSAFDKELNTNDNKIFYFKDEAEVAVKNEGSEAKVLTYNVKNYDSDCTSHQFYVNSMYMPLLWANSGSSEEHNFTIEPYHDYCYTFFGAASYSVAFRFSLKNNDSFIVNGYKFINEGFQDFTGDLDTIHFHTEQGKSSYLFVYVSLIDDFKRYTGETFYGEVKQDQILSISKSSQGKGVTLKSLDEAAALAGKPPAILHKSVPISSFTILAIVIVVCVVGVILSFIIRRKREQEDENGKIKDDKSENPEAGAAQESL